MTTDIVIRYAQNINNDNEIANFSRYGISGENISAVSWEVSKVSRNKTGECLLKKMVKKISPIDTMGELQVLVEMSAEQPDSAIVRYNKTWGMLKASGVCIDDISDKADFVKNGRDGLILSGVGTVNLHLQGLIESLFNCGEKVYFSAYDSKGKCKNLIQTETTMDWMRFVWNNDGIVYFLLGYFEESACELVALGYENKLKPYLRVL